MPDGPPAGELSTRDRRRGTTLFFVLGSAAVVGPAAMDSYLPGLPQLARDLAATPSEAQLTVTSFLVGLAAGQFIAGPLSDVYGRRRPLLIGMSVFGVASLLCALAPSIGALMLLRVVQGITASSGMTIARAVVRDLHSGAAAARYLSRLMLLIGLGPVLSPLAGAQVLRFTSWRGTFVALALIGGALVLSTMRFLPETLPLQRRRSGGLRETFAITAAVIRDRSFAGLVLVSGFGSGAMLCYVAGSSFVLENVYGTSPQLYGLLFGANATVLVAAAQLNAYLVGRRSVRTLLGFGAATLAVAAVVLLVVVPFPRLGLVAVMPPLAAIAFSWSFIQPNAVALALTPYPGVAGSAAAVMGVSQYIFGAALAPLVGLDGGHSAVPMAIVIAVCAAGCVLSLRRVAGTPGDAALPAVVEAVAVNP